MRNHNNLYKISKSPTAGKAFNTHIQKPHKQYFPFMYAIKLRYGGKHLYLAITVPMMTFITVFSQCTLLSDTHTAPTTAQMNSGK